MTYEENNSKIEKRTSYIRKNRRKKLPYLFGCILAILLISGFIVWFIHHLHSNKLEVKNLDELTKELDFQIYYEAGTQPPPKIKWVMVDKHSPSDFNWFELYKGSLSFSTGEESFLIDRETGEVKKKMKVTKSEIDAISFKGLVIKNRQTSGFDNSVVARDQSWNEVWSFTPKHEDSMLWNGSMLTDFPNSQVFAFGNFIRGKFVDKSGVYALDAQTGEKNWGFGIDGEIVNFLKNIDKDEIYITTHGALMAFNSKTGAQNWAIESSGIEALSVIGQNIFVSTGLGVFKVYDVINGKLKWEVTPRMNWGSNWDEIPSVAFGNTVVISEESAIEAYDIENGQKKWSVFFDANESPSPFSFYQAPFYDQNSLYVKSDDNMWFAIELP